MILKEYIEENGAHNNMHRDLVMFRKELAEIFPDLRYTSGYRPGAKTASGAPSRHGKGEAWDIANRPDVYNYLWNTKDGISLLNKYGLGILDETDPETMRRTKATGKHFHIGKDSTLVPLARMRFNELKNTKSEEAVAYTSDSKQPSGVVIPDLSMADSGPDMSFSVGPGDISLQDIFSQFRFDKMSPQEVEENKQREKTQASSPESEEEITRQYAEEQQQMFVDFMVPDPYNYIKLETYQGGGVEKRKSTIPTFPQRRLLDILEPGGLDRVLGNENQPQEDLNTVEPKSEFNYTPVDPRSTIGRVSETTGVEQKKFIGEIPSNSLDEGQTITDVLGVRAYPNIDAVIQGAKDPKELSRDEVRVLQKTLVDEGYMEVKKEAPKNEQEIVQLQKFLLSKGYDLGDYGDNKDGVDGKFGNLTRKALADYNKGLSAIDGIFGPITEEALNIGQRFFEMNQDTDIVKYQENLQNQGYFKGVDYDPASVSDVRMGFGLSGSKCTDTRCTAYVGDEIEKVVGEEGRTAINAYGSAWEISQRVVDAGGKEVFSVFEDDKPQLNSNEIEPYIKGRVSQNQNKLDPEQLQEGDLVNLFYEGSKYKEEAYNEGSKYFTTHTGIVKRNDKGELVVQHNVHGNVGTENLEKLINNEVKHDGNKDLSITAVIRPNYDKAKASKSLYYDSSIAQVNTENVENLEGIGSKEAALFTETIIKNKDRLMEDMPINDGEFNNLVRAAKAIGWKETSFDKIKLEQGPRDWNLKHDVYDRLGELREMFGGKEKSRGMTRLKDERNLTQSLRERYIKDKGRNLDSPTEAAIPTFYTLASRYLYLRDMAKVKGLDYTPNELTKLAILGWNEDISIVGKSAGKYKTYDEVMKQYRGEDNMHPYDLAQTAYDDYLKQ